MKALTTVSRTEAISRKRTVWKRFECATNVQNTKYISRRSRRLFPADRADLRRKCGMVLSRRQVRGSPSEVGSSRFRDRHKLILVKYFSSHYNARHLYVNHRALLDTIRVKSHSYNIC